MGHVFRIEQCLHHIQQFVPFIVPNPIQMYTSEYIHVSIYRVLILFSFACDHSHFNH
ncbi:hypothetical protein BC941DRAFT_407380 [Chlamydoabsidia padenii]|nr:hypothetical protein BC941DRAFT_407380 [Chlamydoabsidia padenii]